MAQPDLHHLQQPDTEPGGCWIGKKKVTFVVHLLGWDVSPWFPPGGPNRRKLPLQNLGALWPGERGAMSSHSKDGSWDVLHELAKQLSKLICN